MSAFLHSLFIWPFQSFIEIFFMIFIKILKNNIGLIIVLLSVIMNLFLIYFYKRSVLFNNNKIENPFLKNGNIKIFSFIKPYIYLILYTFLFIATCDYFYNTTYLINSSFFNLKDLNQPDQLIKIGTIDFNIFPILMFVFAAVSIFAPFIINKRKIAISIVTPFLILFLVFFFLLYNAPCGLVLFWVVAGLFLLFINILSSLKNSEKIFKFLIIIFCALFLLFFINRFNSFKIKYMIALVVIDIAVMFVALKKEAIIKIFETSFFSPIDKDLQGLYRYSSIILFVLTGFAVPLLLFSSSPTEFEDSISMLIRTMLQAGSIFILFAFLFWSFSTTAVQRILSLFLSFTAILAFFCGFVFTGNYGAITPSFVFDNWERIDKSKDLLKTILASGLSFLIIFILFRINKFRWLKDGFIILLFSLVVISGINLFTIIKENNLVNARTENLAEKNISDERKYNIFNFSKTGENIFILFLDKASGHTLPYALDLRPSLKEDFDGFVWYPNTISFGANTLFGLPAMMGGYEYTALKVNERKDISLKDKVNESLKVLPALFGEAGYNVVVTDPTYSNLSWIPDTSIYDDMKNVKSYNIAGIFRNRFNKEQTESDKGFSKIFDYDIMMRFSIFRIFPPFLRPLLYYDGNWLKLVGSSSYNQAIKHYPNLLYLGDLCNVSSTGNNLNIMMNEATHNPGPYNQNFELTSEPVFYSNDEIKKFISAGEVKYIYAYTATLIAISKWFEWLKEEGVYDNTKIIIVSDHGWFFNREILALKEAEFYNPLLLVKDFNSRGFLLKSEEFMTNADVPVIVTFGSLGKSINPYTGKTIDSSPKDERIFVYGGSWAAKNHKMNSLVIEGIIEVKNKNIFDSENWIHLKE